MDSLLNTLRIAGIALASLAATTLLPACGPGGEIEERDFPTWGARVMCAQLRDCTRGAWLNAYYGQADCIASWEDDLEELVDFYDDIDCDYNKREAGDAVSDIRAMDCEEFWEDVYTDPTYSVLDEIWDDCGNNNTVNTFPYSSR